MAIRLFKCDTEDGEEFTEDEVTIYLNEDDDNDNGIEDRNDDEVKADPSKDWTQDEDDLNKMKLEVSSTLTRGRIILRRSADNIRVWKAATKGSTNAVLVGANEKVFNLPEDQAEFNSLKDNLWVEGYKLTEAGPVDLELVYQVAQGLECAKDTKKVEVDPMPIKVERPDGIKQYECVEFNITLSDKFFHHESRVALPDRYFDAFDANCDGNMVKVDATLTLLEQGGPSYEVPCFAMKPEIDGDFEWKLRFAPPKPGTWECEVKAWVRHLGDPLKGDTDEIKRTEILTGGTIQFYEHKHGYGDTHCENFPEAKIKFSAAPADSTKFGPLRKAKGNENSLYLYHDQRVGGNDVGKPFFGLGYARPWVERDIPSPEEEPEKFTDAQWIDRKVDVFEKMKGLNLNLQYIWFAPWETQLVHRKVNTEFWAPNHNGKYRTPNAEFETWAVTGWSGYGYYDQGRAAIMDTIFTDADHPNNVYILLNIWSHQALQEEGHKWEEWGWNTPNDPDFPQEKLNGFSLLEEDILEFFVANPTAERGEIERKSWDYQANFYRYLIARWGCKRMLGVWVILDELEGVGSHQRWWWQNGLGDPWLDNVIGMFRGKLNFKIKYQTDTGPQEHIYSYGNDYLNHPITASTTHCITSGPNANKDITNIGDYYGGQEKIDLISHHTYHFVKSKGKWLTKEWTPGSVVPWFDPEVINDVSDAKRPGEERIYPYSEAWWQTNGDWDWKEEDGTEGKDAGSPRINANYKLWDGIAQRIRNWSTFSDNASRPKTVTEFACKERKRNTENWDVWGKKYPAYEHYAIWAGLFCQHLSIPLQWCDGKHFGEMIGDDPPGSYSPNKADYFPTDYPNNFAQIAPVQNFMSGIDLAEFLTGLEDFQVVDANGSQDTGFKAWGLQKSDLTLAWIYRSGGYLINNIQGWPEDDFESDRSRGENVRIESGSSADDGKDVTIWGLNHHYNVVWETVTLTKDDGTASATTIGNDWQEIVAVHIHFENAGTITVKGATQGLLVCTIPIGGKNWTAGELLMHDSTAVVQGGPATSAQVYVEEFSHSASGWVVVVGTDDYDNVQREAVPLNGGKGITSFPFKTCTKLYIGADRAERGMYTVEEDRSTRKLRVPLANGNYIIKWFNTWTGAFSTDTGTATNGQLEVDLPPLGEANPRIIGDGTDTACQIVPA